MHRAWLVLLLASCVTPKPPTPSGPPAQLTLFFTADLQGSIAPCGCSENMLGGIAKTALQVERARTSGATVAYFDVGNGLFNEPTIPEAAVAQQERKAKALAAAMKKMGLNARLPGALDDARGATFRHALELPELATDTVTWLDVKGHRVAVFGARTEADVKARGLEAKTQGAEFIVALVDLPFDRLTPLALEPSPVDLIIAARAKDALAAEDNHLTYGSPRVVQVQSRGRSLLRVDVNLVVGKVEWLAGANERQRELNALSQRIELLRNQVNEPGLADELKAMKKAKLDDLIARRELLAATPLPAPSDKSSAAARVITIESTFEEDPAVRTIVSAYDEDVSALNLAWAQEHGQDCVAATPEAPGLVGPTLCLSCHPSAKASWETSRHHDAFKALERVKKQHHLDCIGCHVAGWQQPQGVCRIDKTADHEFVSCESCHGPGSLHAANPKKDNIRGAPKADACTTCHDRENSPHFDFEAYVAKIVGPGHGAPAP